MSSGSHPNRATSSTQHIRRSSEEPKDLSSIKHSPQASCLRASPSICVRSHNISFPIARQSSFARFTKRIKKNLQKSSTPPKSNLQHHARSNGTTFIEIMRANPACATEKNKACIQRNTHHRAFETSCSLKSSNVTMT